MQSSIFLLVACALVSLPSSLALISGNQHRQVLLSYFESLSHTDPTPPQPTIDVTDRYIIQFKSRTALEQATALISQLGKMDQASRVTQQFDHVLPNAVAAYLPSVAHQTVLEAHYDDIVLLEAERIATAYGYVDRDINSDNLLQDDSGETQGSYSTEPSPGSWGLKRVSTSGARDPSRTAYYYQQEAGKGVAVFVVDTGITVGHSAFEGRARAAFSAFPSKTDGHGHGTHCAGTIGSRKYGIAPSTSLYAVKVLGDDGSGSTASILSGLDFIAKQRVANPTVPMVASMSLGFGAVVPSVDAAVDALITKYNVTNVIAAGNDNLDACNDTPARVPRAITVGATDANDNKASFSNWGACVDINAPGVSITSLLGGNVRNNQTEVMSGTSMSTPHVAGVVALLMSVNAALKTPAQVATALKNLATKNGVRNPVGNTTRSILFNGYDQ